MKKIIKSDIEHILPSKGYFKIKNVNFHGETRNYEFLEEMTSPMIQNELAKFSKEKKEEGDFYAIGLPQFLAIVKTGVDLKNNDFLNHVHSKLKKYPQFLSRAVYSPADLENGVLHEFGMPEQYFKLGNLVGKDGWIKEIDNKKSLELLTEIEDVKELNNISNSLTENLMYLWRFNSKPFKKIERAVGLDAIEGRLYLVACRNLSYEYPAFLVKQV